MGFVPADRERSTGSFQKRCGSPKTLVYAVSAEDDLRRGGPGGNLEELSLRARSRCTFAVFGEEEVCMDPNIQFWR